ncbi:hypothetical protein KSP40_PGU013887 [Platanthera guangdongensis]|uniref:Uncharacterized protein n=1 Tax=Platanthera guangdongensis TaxID=2320717 RepID=A0ABR2MBT8_9ASPA
MEEEETAVEPEKHAGKGGYYSGRGSTNQDVDVKEISAPILAPEPRTKRGRRIVTAGVTSPMEEEKVMEPEKHAEKGGSYSGGGSIKQDVDVNEISAPTLALESRARRGGRIVTAAVTSPMEEEKVVEPEKHAGKGGSYYGRGSIKQYVDVKEISTPILAPEPRTRRGRRIVAAGVTSLMEEQKAEKPEKHPGKGGSYYARGSIKQDVDVEEISAPSLAPEPLRRRGRRIAIKQHVDVEGISAPSLAPEPPRRSGRRIVAVAVTSPMKEEKVVELEKHVEKVGSYSARGSIKQDVDVKENPDELNENHQKGRAQRKRGIVSRGDSRNNKALKPVAVEGDTIRVGVLKETGEERGVVHKNAEGPTKNGGRGRCSVKSFPDPTTILTKGAPLEPVAEKRKTRRAAKALSMPEEDDEALEKIEGPIKDGGKGPSRTKRGGGSARLSMKDEALEPVVPLMPGRVTRPSAMIIEDEKQTKEEKVQKTTRNRVKQMEISKKSSQSTRISSKDEVSKSVEIEEKIVGSLSSHLEVTEGIQKNNVIVELGRKKKKSKVKDNPIGDRKMLAVRRKVGFVVEETDNDKDAIMSEESNSRRDLDFPDKKDLVYSWSSFSEIRGIPNTTSKYREDRMINCHATPFEARVERALKKGIAESSSSVDIEA